MKNDAPPKGGVASVSSFSSTLTTLTLLLVIVSALSTNTLRAQAPQAAPPADIAQLLAPSAPSSPEQAEQAEPPKLPVENIDPSPHLPGAPGWVVLLTALLVAIPLLLLLTYFLRKSALISPKVPGPSPFASARESLLALRELPAEAPLAEISTRISLTLRGFLTQSQATAALYQTREEFLTDEERLRYVPEPAKSETAEFLNELSSLQYAPPSSDPAQVATLIDKSLQTLESLAQPEPTLPASND